MTRQYKHRWLRLFLYYLKKSFGKVSLDLARLEKLWELEDKVYYRFSDWDLLNQALTHKSYAYEISPNFRNHYEVLEFLGDSVLDMVISQLLIKNYPRATEGELSRSRSLLVNTYRLTRIAREINLGGYLLLGKGEDQDQGRFKPTILTCAYEALIGAIYLDGGLRKVTRVIRNHFNKLFSHRLNQEIFHDYKSQLQEYVQSSLKTIPEYHLLQESGPPHAKKFVIQIKINGKVYGIGHGRNKKEAQQKAAQATLKQLGILNLSFSDKI
ncbi:MAG: ribonuclease III [Desulfobacterota bacterium]|nr:ribonuclease III [Thermodesulfobacteriota bacterium]